MELIKKLAEMAVDEAFGAVKYAKMAVRYKLDEPNLAATMVSLTEQELSHSDSLMTTAHNLLQKHTEHEEYEKTKAVVDYIHEMQVDKINEAKRYLMQYRGA